MTQSRWCLKLLFSMYSPSRRGDYGLFDALSLVPLRVRSLVEGSSRFVLNFFLRVGLVDIGVTCPSSACLSISSPISSLSSACLSLFSLECLPAPLLTRFCCFPPGHPSGIALCVSCHQVLCATFTGSVCSFQIRTRYSTASTVATIQDLCCVLERCVCVSV